MMTKKLSVLFLSLIMVLLAACGAGAAEPAADPDVTETPAVSEPAVSEPAAPEPTAPEPELEPEDAAVTPAASAPTGAGGAELSDDLYDFQVELDGRVLDFPMTYSDFAGFGFACTEDETTTMSSQRYTYVTFRYKDNALMNATLFNAGNSDIPYTQCIVCGLSVDAGTAGKYNVAVRVPGGFELSTLTMEQVEQAFGTPSYSSEHRVEYSLAAYDTVSFSFYDTGNLYDVQTLTVPEDMVAVAPVSSATPDIVKNYQAPAAISGDLADYTFSYAGALYQLPAPVQSFLDNGWTIVEQDSDATAAGKNTGWVTLMKDNQRLHTIVRNYTGNEVPIENCFVTEIGAGIHASSTSTPKVDMVLSGGITIGMSQADLESALSAVAYESEESSGYTYYECKLDPPNIITTVAITVADGAVTSIELDHTPKYSEFGG